MKRRSKIIMALIACSVVVVTSVVAAVVMSNKKTKDNIKANTVIEEQKGTYNNEAADKITEESPEIINAYEDNSIAEQPDSDHMYADDTARAFLETYYNLNADNVDKQYKELLKDMGTNHLYSDLSLFNYFKDTGHVTELIKINKTMFLTFGDQVKIDGLMNSICSIYFSVDCKRDGKQITENGVLILFTHGNGTYKIMNWDTLPEGNKNDDKMIALQKNLSTYKEQAFNLSKKYLSIYNCGGLNNLGEKSNELKAISSPDCYEQTLKFIEDNGDNYILTEVQDLNIKQYEFTVDGEANDPVFLLEIDGYTEGNNMGNVSHDTPKLSIEFTSKSCFVLSCR